MASTNLFDLSSTWVEKIVDLIHPAPASESVYDTIQNAFRNTSTASLTTLGASFLALLFLLSRYLMSHRNSFAASYGGSRSPYTSARLSERDRTISDLYEYVDSKEIETHDVPFENDDAPDLVHVKYMGSSFPLDFPPYSISESGVTVQEVRRRVAEKLKQDPRRIRLVYKEKELKIDPYAIKKYGCKQNSEIAVVVTEHLNDYSGGLDAHHSSEDDSGSAVSLKPQTELRRPRGNSSVRHRSDDYKVGPDTGSFLHPNGYSQRDTGREGRDPRRRSTSPARARSKSPAPPSPRTSFVPPSPRPTPSPAPPKRPPPADPKTPLGKVQALQNQFYDKWMPDCRNFVASPPSDPATRDKEYRRVSESVMRNVIEAADAIDLEGDTVARAERRELLREAQELLKRVDAVKK